MITAGMYRGLAGLLLASAVYTNPGAHAAPPNVVFILMDDLGWKDLSCQGSDFIDTPRIDSIAAEGTRFTNAYAACPVCSPTRASIMTGKSPAELHLTDFLKGRRSPAYSPVVPAEYEDGLPAEAMLLPKLFGENGYRTGHVGKMHLGGPSFDPQDAFYYTYGSELGGASKSFFNDKGEYLTDTLTTKACEFIETNAAGPFLLYLAHYAPHVPIEAKPEKVEKYQKKAKEMGAAPYGQRNAEYAAMVECADDGVGQVLDTLDRLGLRDKTIVIFTSDNGGLATEERGFTNTPATTNAPLRAGKGHLYEGGIRVPLLVRWPGHVKAGVVSDTPFISYDFLPTLIGLTGVQSAIVGMEGIDMSAAWLNPATALHPPLFWHYPHFGNQGGFPGGAMRMDNWKLIERYEDGTLELYNLATDPSERHNLALQELDRTKAMAEQLRQWRAKVNATMPGVNPAMVE